MDGTRGGVKTDGSGEQVREEAADLAQERPLGLHASRSCWKSARVMTSESESPLFEGFVVASFGIEPVVSVVHSAEQNGHSFFQED
jgi:hypothetical protein